MKIQFGMARRCINPQVPVSLAGYFNIRMWDKVLDDIEVRAVVFRQGTEIAGILNFDLVTIPLYMCDRIFERLREKGIRDFNRKNLTLCAIHTHTGPEIRQGRAGESPECAAFIVEMAVQALEEALLDHQEGELYCGLTADSRFLFNRRYWMKNGRVMTNPGKFNAEILRPEGEIDPEIPLLAIKQNEKIKVLFCNIVNHTDTIGGTGVSSDWPGFLRRTVEGSLGKNSMVCTLIGASGNINHFDVNSSRNQTCYEEAQRIGLGYAETVSAALSTLEKVDGNTMKILGGEVCVMPREISDSEVEKARETVEKYKDSDINSGKEMTSEDLAKGAPAVLKYFAENLLKQSSLKEKHTLYLTGIVFGSSFILASLPSEPFTEIGLTLRKEIFPDRICMVPTLANGTGTHRCGGGYIPNAWNYGRGGYEDTPRSNPFSMKTASEVLNAWRKLAEKL